MQNIYSVISDYRQPLAIAVLVILLLLESTAPFFDFFQKRFRLRLIHDIRNLTIGTINIFAVTALFVSLWVMVIEWTGRHDFGLLNFSPLPAYFHFAGAILLLDFWTYWWHRFNHCLPFLWIFHKVHHSDPQMDVTTANRFHLGEIILSSLLRLPVFLITGITLGELVLYEMIMFANTQIHHANIGFPEKYDRLLRIFFTSPAMHKVHHSRVVSETNSNYTALLSIWDRVFRSFRLRGNPRTIQYGLDETDRPEQLTIKGLFLMPFVRAKKTPR